MKTLAFMTLDEDNNILDVIEKPFNENDMHRKNGDLKSHLQFWFEHILNEIDKGNTVVIRNKTTDLSIIHNALIDWKGGIELCILP